MTWRYRGQKESQAHHKASCKDRLLRPYLMLQVPSQHVSKSKYPDNDRERLAGSGQGQTVLFPYIGLEYRPYVRVAMHEVHNGGNRQNCIPVLTLLHPRTSPFPWDKMS